MRAKCARIESNRVTRAKFANEHGGVTHPIRRGSRRNSQESRAARAADVSVKRHEARRGEADTNAGYLGINFIWGLHGGRSENAYAQGCPRGVSDARERTPRGSRAPQFVQPASRPASVSLVSKSINNLYHLVHSTEREPICTCVSPYREPAGAALLRHAEWNRQESLSLSISLPRLHIVYTGCADKLYGFDTNGLAGSDVSSAEIGRVQVLTRFPATTRDPVTSVSLFQVFI